LPIRAVTDADWETSSVLRVRRKELLYARADPLGFFSLTRCPQGVGRHRAVRVAVGALAVLLLLPPVTFAHG